MPWDFGLNKADRSLLRKPFQELSFLLRKKPCGVTDVLSPYRRLRNGLEVSIIDGNKDDAVSLLLDYIRSHGHTSGMQGYHG